jgi:hypothetical protein
MLSNATGNTTQDEYGNLTLLHTPSRMEDLLVDDELAGQLLVADFATKPMLESAENFTEEELQAFARGGGGWYGGGDKLWGGGHGIEDVNGGNAGYYNSGMFQARARCGGPGCALIVNPPGHRTVSVFHIHVVHYAGYGASLKHRLESLTCRSPGWHAGGLPCAGKAAFFQGFPAVFSAAMGGGGVQSASVVAWPASCGGRGTIVQLAYGCSIEHQIRGDFKR